MKIDIIRIHDTPMKLLMKDKWTCIGCFWYGDNFVQRESFTDEQKALYEKYHASNLKERIDDISDSDTSNSS